MHKGVQNVNGTLLYHQHGNEATKHFKRSPRIYNKALNSPSYSVFSTLYIPSPFVKTKKHARFVVRPNNSTTCNSCCAQQPLQVNFCLRPLSQTPHNKPPSLITRLLFHFAEEDGQGKFEAKPTQFVLLLL